MSHRWEHPHSSPDRAGRSPLPFEQGPVRISGTTSLDSSWQVIPDRLGWKTVVLASGLPDAWSSRLLSSLGTDAEDVARAAVGLDRQLRRWAEAESVGVALARIAPEGRLIEFYNASLPTVLHWDPIEGVSPYEPAHDQRSEVVRFSPGAALIFATEGVLGRGASWSDLRAFTRDIGLEPLGGNLAEAPSAELARLIRDRRLGYELSAAGLVVIGLPLALPVEA